MYEPLIFFERERIDRFVPVLSTDWAVSEDRATYTFSIRPGVRFHEGGTLEPHDVAYSVQRGLLQDRSAGPQWILLDALLGVFSIEQLASQIAGVEDFAEVDPSSLVATCEQVKQAVAFDDDEGTVTFNLAKPFGPFLQVLASGWGSVLDMDWMSSQGDWDGGCEGWTRWHDPVAQNSVLFDKMNGTGPFKFERWLPGEEWSIVRNEDYWLGEPLWDGGPSGPAALERAVVKLVPEWGTRLAMFQAGDADSIYVPTQFISQIDPMVREAYDTTSEPSVPTTENPHGTARLYRNLPLVGSMDAFFNFQVNTEGGNPFVGSGKLDGLGVPPDFFSDEHARRAFSYAFDYETFLADVYLNEAVRRTGPTIAGHMGYDSDQDVYPYDLEKAEEEFRLALDGELWEAGFFLVVLYNTGNDQARAAAEILELGVESISPGNFKVAIQDIPWPTYLNQMVSSRLPFFFAGWQEDYHHPNSWVQPYMHSSGAISSLQSFPPELSAGFDAQVEACLTLLGDEARTCYEDLQRQASEAAIDLFLVQETGRHYEQLWVDGWYFNPAYPEPYIWFYALSK